MTDDERELAGEGTFEETAANGSPFRLRFVAHDPEAYELYYNVVANPVLWFVHHGLWALGTTGADLTGPWRTATPSSTTHSRRQWSTSSTCGRMPWFSSRTTTSTSSRDACASRSRPCCPTSCTSVARAGGVARPARADSSRAPRVAARQRRRRFPHRAGGDAPSSPRPRTSSEPGNGRMPLALAAPISVDAEEFEALAEEPGRARPRGRAASWTSRAADPAGRPRRPGEERGSWLSRVRTAPRAAGSPRPRRHGRAARSLARQIREYRRPRRDRERRARSSSVSPATAGDRCGWRCATTSPSPSPRTSSSTFCSSTRYATA